MIRRRSHLAALAAALVACGHSAQPPAPLAESFSVDASVLQFPPNGGTAILRSPDRLQPRRWEISGVPAIGRTLGTDLDDQMVYVVSHDGRLVALDLLARRARVFPNHLRELAGTPDGVVIGLDSAHRPMRLANRTMSVFHAAVKQAEGRLLPGPGTSVIAVNAGVGQVIDEQGVLRQLQLPTGPATTTWYGDLIAVTTDSGIVLVNPSGKTQPRFVPVRGTPTAAVFSPSGHQLYVARKDRPMLIVDRFTGEQLGTMALPIASNALRVDRTGRWLMAGGAGADSVAVVDLSTSHLLATVAAPWGPDLPMVPDGKTLLVRDGKDVVSRSLTDSLHELGRIGGGASSLYLAVDWSPQLTVPEVTPTVLATTSAQVDTTVAVRPVSAGDSAAAAAAPAAVYLQVSSSQNQDWAAAFAKQLKDGGFPAQVLSPQSADEGYRVVVGPYPTRDQADSVGKRLGRPYFILTPGATDR